MKFIRGGVLLTGLLGVASTAQAGVTSTWTITNDYDFRGNTQSAKDIPHYREVSTTRSTAVSTSARGAATLISACRPAGRSRSRLGADLYAGFPLASLSEDSGLTYDVGIIEYAYPDESDFTYTEIYASLAEGWFKGKVWYSPKFGGSAAEDLAQSLVGKDDVAAGGTSKRTPPFRCPPTSRCSATWATALATTGITRSATTRSTMRSAWATPPATSRWVSSGSIRTAT